jgi:hypothetical protein
LRRSLVRFDENFCCQKSPRVVGVVANGQSVWRLLPPTEN